MESLAKRVEEQQQETLLAKIRRNAGSAFGREHRFDEIRSTDDFRRNVPVSDYAGVAPYIQKVIEGDERALFGAGQRVRLFALTSGTTQRSKHLPITDAFIREYRYAWWIWAHLAEKAHPLAFDGKVLQLTSPACERKTDLGVPCGSVSGLIARIQPSFVRRMYVFPSAGSNIKDGATKYYAAMRLAITRDVSFITTANPSTVLSVLRVATDLHEELIRDVRDGTITFPVQPRQETVRALAGRLRPDPKGAKRLEGIRRRRGRLVPRELWPNLSLVGCWKGGTLQNYLARLNDELEGVPVRDIGLIASEGRMTIPISSEGSAGVLDLTSHFYEFIPSQETSRQAPRTLLAHELEEGLSYVMVLTTSAGLYRYNINDVVKVVGFHHSAPVLEFLNKGSGTSSITGEKLSEFQVVCAVAAASGGGQPIATFTFVPQWDEPPCYCVLVEEGALEGVSCDAFLDRLDRQLQRLNIEYESKRRTGRLGPVRLRRLPAGAWERYRDFKIERNRGRLEQYKHVYLEQDFDFLGKLEKILG